MKTGIFGGSFNPIHNGHIHLAESVRDSLKLDRVILLPSRISPHRDSSEYVSGADRLEMCRLATEDIKGLEVSDFELKRNEVSYTINTVRHFREKFPDDELFLLIGSDMLLTFDEWREFEEIMKNVTLAVVSRQNGDMSELTEKAESLSKYGRINITDVPPITVSSTLIRKNLKNNIDCSCYLNIKVVQYIRLKKLYLS